MCEGLTGEGIVAAVKMIRALHAQGKAIFPEERRRG